MLKTICIYHAECTDGAGAAAVVRHKFPDAICVAAKHGEALTVDASGAKVFVVDFSFPVAPFRELAAKAAEIFWYDHHKTAVAFQKELGFGVLDLEESGATLTWKQLFPKKPVPPVLAYIRDKDIWRWELPDSREINTTLYSIDGITDPTHPIWETLLKKTDKSLRAMRDTGRFILDYEHAKLVKGAKRGFAVDFHGHRALAVNWTDETSTIGEYIYQDLGYEVAILFSHSGEYWKFSLRSNRVDVSQLAQKYGGGGHAGAAGFKRDDIEWLVGAGFKPALTRR